MITDISFLESLAEKFHWKTLKIGDTLGCQQGDHLVMFAEGEEFFKARFGKCAVETISGGKISLMEKAEKYLIAYSISQN